MLTVRSAELADQRPLFELVRAFPTPTPPDWAAFIDALQSKLADPSSYLGVVEEGGVLRGYVAGSFHSTFYASGRTAWVDELLVDVGVRGQGVGRKLMEAFEAWAAERGCKLVGLATRGASGFYERNGYQSKASYYKKYLGGG